MMGRFNIYC